MECFVCLVLLVNKRWSEVRVLAEERSQWSALSASCCWSINVGVKCVFWLKRGPSGVLCLPRAVGQ